MRVAVVYNEPVQVDDPSEYGVIEQTRLVARFLEESGYAVVTFGVDSAAKLISFLNEDSPRAVFNCCEGFRGSATLEMHVAGLYEMAGVAYTGSPALTLGLSLNKALAKAVLEANGIPTPRFGVLHSIDDLSPIESLSFPLIVKPVAEDASLGIDRNSVVHDRDGLIRQAQRILAQFHQAALVEEYIPGREFNAALLAADSAELTALPLSEIVFEGMPEGHPDIVSFDAKWRPETRAYQATVPRCPAIVDHRMAELMSAIAIKAARALGLRDYGRVDFRLREADHAVFVLEVNPNPDISADSGFMRAVEASGRSPKEAVRSIMARALERATP